MNASVSRTPASVVSRNAWSRLTTSLSSANDGETATARSNAPRGNGVGRSETGACVNADAMVAPRSAPSVATSSPCCAAQDKYSSRKDARSASVIARTGSRAGASPRFVLNNVLIIVAPRRGLLVLLVPQLHALL